MMEYAESKEQTDKTLAKVYDLIEDDELKNDLKLSINSLRDRKFKEDFPKLDITKQEYVDYERVRTSGMTNMFDVSMVSDLSGLSKEKIRIIMNNYDTLMEMYPEVRQ